MRQDYLHADLCFILNTVPVGNTALNCNCDCDFNKLLYKLISLAQFLKLIFYTCVRMTLSDLVTYLLKIIWWCYWLYWHKILSPLQLGYNHLSRHITLSLSPDLTNNQFLVPTVSFSLLWSIVHFLWLWISNPFTQDPGHIWPPL